MAIGKMNSVSFGLCIPVYGYHIDESLLIDINFKGIIIRNETMA